MHGCLSTRLRTVRTPTPLVSPSPPPLTPQYQPPRGTQGIRGQQNPPGHRGPAQCAHRRCCRSPAWWCWGQQGRRTAWPRRLHVEESERGVERTSVGGGGHGSRAAGGSASRVRVRGLGPGKLMRSRPPSRPDLHPKSLHRQADGPGSACGARPGPRPSSQTRPGPCSFPCAIQYSTPAPPVAPHLEPPTPRSPRPMKPDLGASSTRSAARKASVRLCVGHVGACELGVSFRGP